MVDEVEEGWSIEGDSEEYYLEWCVYRVFWVRRGGVFVRVRGYGGWGECINWEFFDGGIRGDCVSFEDWERKSLFDDEIINWYDGSEWFD